MELTADRTLLAQTLGTVTRAISARSTLPILSNVLLEAESGQLVLTATDLDTSIRARMEARVKAPGAISVAASYISEVVGLLPTGEVDLVLKEQQFLVRAGRSKYSMLTLPAEEFPGVPEVSDQIALRLPQTTLKDMIRQTIFAVAREESNPILTGLLLEVRSGRLNLVATDTHRLAWRSTKLVSAPKEKISLIIPNRPLNELQRLLKDGESEVTLHLTENQVAFITESATLVSRVIDGQFPNYEKVVPKEAERTIIASTRELVGVLKRVAIVARQNAEKVVLTVDRETLALNAESQEVGQGSEELSVRLEGEPLEIAFNVRYLIDALSVIDTENSVLQLTGALNPGIVKPEHDEEFVYVVMPMQI